MKTGAWLRGGRGKIAGMVAQKSSDGKGTVLRELVTPSNPQTVDQMATRLAFGTVTQAAALMLPIIGQTFKGQSDEKMNRRRFVSLNVPVLKAEALKQRNGGAINGAFRGKTSTALIPNSYIISEGTLLLPATVTPVYDVDAGVDTPNFEDRTITLVNNQKYSPAKVLADFLGILPKQQLTVVGIGTVREGGEINYYASGSEDFVRESDFYGGRLVFNQDAPDFTFLDTMDEDEVVDALMVGVNSEKTSATVLSTIRNSIEFDSATKVAKLNTTLANFITNVYVYLQGMGVVISQLDDNGWNYSNSSMVVAPPYGDVATSNIHWYGLTFNDALIDYIGAEAASKLFTRKGGFVNDF